MRIALLSHADIRLHRLGKSLNDYEEPVRYNGGARKNLDSAVLRYSRGTVKVRPNPVLDE